MDTPLFAARTACYDARSTGNGSWPSTTQAAATKRAEARQRRACSIVEARYYEDIADALLAGATRVLDEAGAAYDVITVPGALEIPAAIAIALDAADAKRAPYDGVVALGCVIRGETYHFDIVCERIRARR